MKTPLHIARLLQILVLACWAEGVTAQQFAGDNQWVAPHGVATLVATAGEEYSQLMAVAALLPEWEFNLQLTHNYDDPRDDSGSYTATNIYFKRRLKQSEDEKSGYAVLFGTGLFPEHREQGQVSNALTSWWATGVATYKLDRDGQVLLDVLPGIAVNTDPDNSDDTSWGFTYTSRLAVYGLIPQSAVVGEVFGTAGEAYAEPAYRIGVRWESRKWVAALTYSDAFDGSGGAGIEFGLMYFTEPRFCMGGCRRR
jgi:hypothetical protein